jgi:ribosomal protein S18 acetylase RimI-like enzyme
MLTTTVASFLPPFETEERRQEILEWWKRKGEETLTVGKEGKSARDIIYATVEPEGEVAGVVMLDKPFTETGPFRGGVEKLLVDPKFRRRGIAKALMEKLEEVAENQGRTYLVCPIIITHSI